MTLNETRRLVEAETRLLAPRLFEGMSTAIAAADGRAKGLLHKKYPHLRPGLIRAELREYLEAEGVPGTWRLDGNPRPYGGALPCQSAGGVQAPRSEGAAEDLPWWRADRRP
jgi:hypothetical protein